MKAMQPLTVPSLTRDEVFSQLHQISQKESFNKDHYLLIDIVVKSIAHLKKTGGINQEDIATIQHFFGQDFLENTLHGMALLKKFGYAGDFLMIDKIYTGNTSSNAFFQSWDDYFQNHAAPKAVRNRKEYFKKLMTRKLKNKSKIKLLNVASGPSRDLAELYDQLLPGQELITTCVEMDKHAINYASQLIKGHASQVSFINKNIFKFDTDEQFDMIWSAGLFDYFDDKAFVYILNKFKNWIAPHGEIIVGNFNSQHNPTRDYMELFGDWYLHHRSSNELIALAIQAGFDESQVAVGCETERVNLFLKISMG
jgi:extracellular factor (EF) 3-hydroxypalmitic acid methyl ester biosynthesis protein